MTPIIFRDLIAHRPRFIFTILLGVVSFFIFPDEWSVITRALLGWNLAIWTYLFLLTFLFLGSNHESVIKVAQREDSSALSVLLILVTAAIVSLLAIVVELTQLRGLSAELRLVKYLFAGATVLGAWFLLGTVFTFHYAVLYYRSPKNKRALGFPDQEEHPDYWDFLYFSFTIAVAMQTSDIVVVSREMRRAVLAHSILSFMFNAAILGFSINIAAGIVGN
ncbi:DUF1345 domain-containing protein [Undibacterium flavidum]|uniref:DUF1345 domain-containing protein n=1 Tax=Undibacterium flavidum TaxID=2762297 RepID=A0ABR6Y5W4_9BURK|nr:DUF1345 domain-containing protein [Undibacterium flavidum]MBC3872001.1 DUF1345 domain-containing protein [Undibacterium flavidum]